jgi:hypothetical protein
MSEWDFSVHINSFFIYWVLFVHMNIFMFIYQYSTIWIEFYSGARQCYACRKMAGSPSASPIPQQLQQPKPNSDIPLSGVMCGRCDRFTCPMCYVNCFQCQRAFCKFCSTVSYSGPFEQSLCVDCSDYCDEVTASGMCD